MKNSPFTISFHTHYCASLLLALALIANFTACEQASSKKRPRVPVIRDTTVTKINAFITTFLDSARVASYLSSAGLHSSDSADILDFYKGRNYEFAWFDSAGLTDHATSFISLYRSYRNNTNDSSLDNKILDGILDSLLEDTSFTKMHSEELPQTELELTRQFFLFSEKAYGDGGIDPADLGWFIPKKKLDTREFLDSVVNSKGKPISEFEPVHPMFSPLHEYLAKYTAIEKNTGWPEIIFTKKQYKAGDSAAEIGEVKMRLHLLDDLPATDTGDVFTDSTRLGVLRFQHRYGLKEDGILNPKTIAELNRPITDRIRQLLVNIERIKWSPKPGQGRYILVNIPAFTLYAYDSGRLQFTMNVVVGSQAHNTVVFSDEVQIIAFSPYWNVPYSIVKNEMRGKSSAYFARNNYEIVGKYSDGLPQVRQKPGAANALGKVKFLFPNSYSIYMHDTPSKSLFGQNFRAASHGCIRLGEPEKMASWLLDYDPNWTQDSIRKSMNLPAEKQIRLKRKVPVFIGYFTAWVDQQGKVNFRDDIYGHDKEMVSRLFTKN